MCMRALELLFPMLLYGSIEDSYDSSGGSGSGDCGSNVLASAFSLFAFDAIAGNFSLVRVILLKFL